MTPITKAENKLEALKIRAASLTPYKQKITKHAIEKLSEIIELYICRKRKTEKDQLENLYTCFLDEFDIIYIDISEKIEGGGE